MRLFAAFVLQILLSNQAYSSPEEEDLYKLLGVAREATSLDIKRAYRRKARDTHPDKRTDVRPAQAAKEFHRVVHAFEILSDDNSRRTYDATGRTSFDNDNQLQQQGTYYTNFWSQSYSSRLHRKNDQLNVKRAMSRVMHIVSLSQLETLMLDENGLLERNLLICFFTPGTESIVHDDMVFPYPFAHMSDEGIWWEDLLQTVEVWFYQSTDLTNYFDIPEPGQLDAAEQPIFLFGRRGQPMVVDTFARLQTSHYNQWMRWVWKQMEVSVTFVNGHSHPIEAFVMRKGKPMPLFTLQPGHTNSQDSMLAQEWWFRDKRVDTYPGAPNRHAGSLIEETMVAILKMTNDTSPQYIDIQEKSCLDLASNCDEWLRQGQCNHNEDFVKEKCRLTCRFCSEDKDAMKMLVIKKEKQKEKAARTLWKDEF